MYLVYFYPLKDIHTHISVHAHTHIYIYKIDVYNYTRNGKHIKLLKTWQTWNCLKHSLGKDPNIYGLVFKMRGTFK